MEESVRRRYLGFLGLGDGTTAGLTTPGTWTTWPLPTGVTGVEFEAGFPIGTGWTIGPRCTGAAASVRVIRGVIKKRISLLFR